MAIKARILGNVYEGISELFYGIDRMHTFGKCVCVLLTNARLCCESLIKFKGYRRNVLHSQHDWIFKKASSKTFLFKQSRNYFFLSLVRIFCLYFPFILMSSVWAQFKQTVELNRKSKKANVSFDAMKLKLIIIFQTNEAPLTG